MRGSKKTSRTRARHKRGQHSAAIHGGGHMVPRGWGNRQGSAWLPPRQAPCSLGPQGIQLRVGQLPAVLAACVLQPLGPCQAGQEAQWAAWRPASTQRKPRLPKRAASCAVCSAPSGSGWSAWPWSPAMHAATAASYSAAYSAVVVGDKTRRR